MISFYSTTTPEIALFHQDQFPFKTSQQNNLVYVRGEKSSPFLLLWVVVESSRVK